MITISVSLSTIVMSFKFKIPVACDQPAVNLSASVPVNGKSVVSTVCVPIKFLIVIIALAGRRSLDRNVMVKAFIALCTVVDSVMVEVVKVCAEVGQRRRQARIARRQWRK